MNTKAIKRIVILGGGMTGWTVAAALAKGLQGMSINIVLIDSAQQTELDLDCEITTPACVAFHQFLGVTEQDVLVNTGSSFLLATQFSKWSGNQQNYFMPFSDHGFMLNRIDFPQYAVSRYLNGDTLNFDEFSLAATAAKAGRFCHPSVQQSSLFSTLSYGFSLNTATYADYLHKYALHSGVEHICVDASSLKLDADGYIESITLSGSEQNNEAQCNAVDSVVRADFYIDCSGIHANIIEKVLHVEWLSAAQCLPVTHALSHAETVDSHQIIPVYRKLETAAAGWVQEIHTQTHTEQQHFYHADFANAEQACAAIGIDLVDVENKPLKMGRRQLFWYKNCVAMGEAAGNIDVQGTGKLHLVQSAILRLIGLFPKQIHAEFNSAEYNRLTHLEYDHIEDFHVLHYQLANTRSTDYWQHAARIKLSDRLLHKLELFKTRGLIAFYEGETFSSGVWTSLLLGNGFWPQRSDPLIRTMDSRWIDQQLGKMKKMINNAAESMPLHADYMSKQKCNIFQSTKTAATAN